MASFEEKGMSMPAITHQASEVTITEIKGTPPTDIEQPALDETEEPEFVDGTMRSWVIVFAAFFSQMISMGFCNVYGVFQVTIFSISLSLLVGKG